MEPRSPKPSRNQQLIRRCHRRLRATINGCSSSTTTNFNWLLMTAIVLMAPLYFGTVVAQVCGPPAVPLNAKVKTVSGGERGGFTEASYECDPGYELIGPAEVRCNSHDGWGRELPFCGTNVALLKPANQSTSTRGGPASFANDGKKGNNDPDAQECSETQNDTSPWWQVDLLSTQTIRAVRVWSRGCCGHPPLQDVEIRVGNNNVDLQRNRLCAWNPGTVEENTVKTFHCARPLVGRYVSIQLVGDETGLTLCEVEVFSVDELSPETCTTPGLSADTILSTFSRTCYEFHIKHGKAFDDARKICQSHGGDLIHNFNGATTEFLLSELDRRKTDLRTQMVWIGAQKEPGLLARVWKWVNGDVVLKPAWGKDQPNNYNGEQNCVVLDGGRNWLWNDVGCNLDYLHFVCQHLPLSCGSPDSNVNTTVSGGRQNHTIGGQVRYSCPVGSAIIGAEFRTCEKNGVWGESAPTCKHIDCGGLPTLDHGTVRMSEDRTTLGAQATYTCHENYTLIGNENRTCALEGWTGSMPQCLVDWCPDPPQVAGGSVQSTGKRAGATSTYTCNAGYVLIGEPILSCGLGGEWNGKQPVCRFVDCGAPARPDRGSLKLLNTTTTVGSVVKYQCDDDYWLVGPAELTCNKDGKWSGDTPACELVTCDTPHVPPGSYVVGYDYNIHSSIEYHCDPGHLLRGEATRRCNENGEWTGKAPNCEYIDCGTLQPIPHGAFKYVQNKTYVGSEALYSCTNTHTLSGATRRVCQLDGAWSESTPRCEEIRCPEPVLAEHSILSVTGNDRMYGRTFIRTLNSSNSVQTYKIGALAKYRCERGYKIVGDPLVTCEENGLWSGTVPECIFVDCHEPPQIANGKSILSTNATYYGATVMYECNVHFKLDGVVRRLCLENGTWGYEEPQCKEITCTEPDLSAEVIVEMGDRTVGSQAKFLCSRGYTLIGNDSRSCLKSGHWSGKSPTCKAVDCGQPSNIENGRVIVINESTLYGGSIEYHCVPNFNRIGPYLRKCMDDGLWSGSEPHCAVSTNEAQESTGLGMSIAIGAAVIVILLILTCLVVLHRNKARPVKNTENVQGAESKEDANAAVMSYSSLENSRRDMEIPTANRATFNTFQPGRNAVAGGANGHNNNRSTENIYDQIPNEAFYDAPYEMRSNEEVYEPEPIPVNNTITINGISVR